ncbi:glutamate racemase [soil metagenome]
MKIGIFDYGIGGLGLFKILREKAAADIVYFSDSGFKPYGKASENELRERVIKVINYFHSIGIIKIAIACNAASTVINSNDNISGIIEHGINMVINIHPDKIAVVGGGRTIESQIYSNAIEKYGINVNQQNGQQLSLRIEAGDVSSKELDEDIKRIFEPLSSYKYILLACTHYPIIANRIKFFFKDFILLDPAEEMLKWIIKEWHPLTGNSSLECFTTGDVEKMNYASESALKIKICEINKILLE